MQRHREDIDQTRSTQPNPYTSNYSHSWERVRNLLPDGSKPNMVEGQSEGQRRTRERASVMRIPFMVRVLSGPTATYCMHAHHRQVQQPCQEFAFAPRRLHEVPILNLDRPARLTPNEFPVAHDGEVDLHYYGMMMGGLPNNREKKLAALSILSKLSGVSIGLVGVHLFPDGFIQPHTGGHLTFFYVQGRTAAESVMQWSKCLLVCEDEIVVVLNSEGEPEQAEKILRAIDPTHADGTPFRKMGHPCPIEFKVNTPKRRAPLPVMSESSSYWSSPVPTAAVVKRKQPGEKQQMREEPQQCLLKDTIHFG